MFQYKISIDKKVIAILGPHLYGDTASVIAEMVANAYDADAEHCWVTIKTGAHAEITIEDDGVGMTPEEVNKYFLDIGYDRREERPLTARKRKVFGRKGIGKLAAFSLAKRIELYSLKDDSKAGCILDYDKITRQDQDPETIPDASIVFHSQRVSPMGTGTRIVLKDLRRNINTAYYHLVNRLVRTFNIDFEDFKIFLTKNDGPPRKVDYADLDFFEKMDTIITIGKESSQRAEQVKNNTIPEKYKRVYVFEERSAKTTSRTLRKLRLPDSIEVVDKEGARRAVEFNFYGWIGTIVDKGHLRGLVYSEGADTDEQDSISINDNRITIYSRQRIGEYDVLPKVQSDTVYDAYVIGEIHIDLFEDDELVDMAISNRRGYEETDERYVALISVLKTLLRFIVQRKTSAQKARNADDETREANRIKRSFTRKSRTMEILKARLKEEERLEVVEENYQFARATKLSHSTKKIMISHNSENKEYGLFLLRIFDLLGMDVRKTVVFTSHSKTSVPHGRNIYDYLKDCFREDIYVIFLFSRHFYDSNVCVAETGAAWATNRSHSNVVIDIDFEDIDKPIDSAKASLSMGNVSRLDRSEMVKFVKTVYAKIELEVPKGGAIRKAIKQAVSEFEPKLGTDGYLPSRKYQAHPTCRCCGNRMELRTSESGPHFKCTTPKCPARRRRLSAEIG